MIEIDNLSFKYNDKDILENISLSIADGDFFAIVGPNGSGKSTLIKCLIGINEVAHNQIKIDGTCISCFSKYDQIGYVRQLTANSYQLPITGREIMKLISKDKKRQEHLIDLLDIHEVVDQNINDLSGGQTQRVNIAIAMVNDIKYLILDEPTTGLDVASRDNLYKILNDLNNEGITIIIVTHNLEELEAINPQVFRLGD